MGTFFLIDVIPFTHITETGKGKFYHISRFLNHSGLAYAMPPPLLVNTTSGLWTDLRSKLLELGVVLDFLDVVDGETHQQVHHDDAHHHHEHHEQEHRRSRERQLIRIICTMYNVHLYVF